MGWRIMRENAAVRKTGRGFLLLLLATWGGLECMVVGGVGEKAASVRRIGETLKIDRAKWDGMGWGGFVADFANGRCDVGCDSARYGGIAGEMTIVEVGEIIMGEEEEGGRRYGLYICILADGR